MTTMEAWIIRARMHCHLLLFHRQSKQVLEGKAKLLCEQGKGKRPNASNALTTTEEEKLWKSGKLGSGSARVLSQTMWWILTQQLWFWRCSWLAHSDVNKIDLTFRWPHELKARFKIIYFILLLISFLRFVLNPNKKHF